MASEEEPKHQAGEMSCQPESKGKPQTTARNGPKVISGTALGVRIKKQDQDIKRIKARGHKSRKEGKKPRKLKSGQEPEDEPDTELLFRTWLHHRVLSLARREVGSGDELV